MYNSSRRSRCGARRRWSVEPLEVRSLLSALVVDSSVDRIDVVELVSSGDELSRDIENRNELPSQVVRELEAHFPGAIWESAEFDPGSESPYHVSVPWRGLNLEVEFSLDGQVMATAQMLPFDELPQVVQDWISQRFPDAEIRDAERLTMGSAVTYEIEFVTRDQQHLEATLRLPDRDANAAQNASATRTAEASDPGAAAGNVPVAGQLRTDREATSLRDVTARPPQIDNRTADSQAMDLVAPSDTTRPVAPSLSARAATIRAGRSLVSAVALETVAAITPAGPRMIHALSDVLPLDLAEIEQALQQFLEDVYALKPEAPAGAGFLRWTPPLAAAVLAMFGIERIASERRRAKRSPVLATASNRSTWSWVLNLSSWSCSEEHRR